MYNYGIHRRGGPSQTWERPTSEFFWTAPVMPLFVLILTGWRQMGFNCQILAPRENAIENPATPEKSHFLDYISPPAPFRLWATFRHDWAVFASTLGMLLLQIVVIFSTGLLVLTPTTMFDNSAIPRTNQYCLLVPSSTHGTNATPFPKLQDALG